MHFDPNPWNLEPWLCTRSWLDHLGIRLRRLLQGTHDFSSVCVCVDVLNTSTGVVLSLMSILADAWWT